MSAAHLTHRHPRAGAIVALVAACLFSVGAFPAFVSAAESARPRSQRATDTGRVTATITVCLHSVTSGAVDGRRLRPAGQLKSRMPPMSAEKHDPCEVPQCARGAVFPRATEAFARRTAAVAAENSADGEDYSVFATAAATKRPGEAHSVVASGAFERSPFERRQRCGDE
jgi:hypothetical protein